LKAVLQILTTAVFLAGLGQLALVLASLAIPPALGWKEETARLRPLTRQVFWTYAAYIWSTNLCFGLLSTLASHWLVDRIPLAGALSAFIAAYWGVRLLIQLVYFDRTGAPQAPGFRTAETALAILFFCLTCVYAAVALYDLGGLGT
jgi:hypothetical protein